MSAPASLGCARCGSCCDPIIMTASNAKTLRAWSSQALEGVPDPADDEGWTHWLNDGWAEDSRDDAIAKMRPDAPDRQTADFADVHWHLREEAPDGAQHFDCDQFDPDARLCKAGEDRPPVCRFFPWYLDGPTADRAEDLHSHCSYLLDLPAAGRPEGARPLIPIEVI